MGMILGLTLKGLLDTFCITSRQLYDQNLERKKSSVLQRDNELTYEGVMRAAYLPEGAHIVRRTRSDAFDVDVSDTACQS